MVTHAKLTNQVYLWSWCVMHRWVVHVDGAFTMSFETNEEAVRFVVLIKQDFPWMEPRLIDREAVGGPGPR